MIKCEKCEKVGNSWNLFRLNVHGVAVLRNTFTKWPTCSGCGEQVDYVSAPGAKACKKKLGYTDGLTI